MVQYRKVCDAVMCSDVGKFGVGFLQGKSESVISIWVLMLPCGAALQRT